MIFGTNFVEKILTNIKYIMKNKMKNKMKRIVCILAVLLTAFSTGIHAQVAIGTDNNPHDGAVLDLAGVPAQNLGFLLPRVSLADVAVWQLQGNPANGVGMMVYNTNPSTIGGTGKAGVYIWNGMEWESLKSNFTDVVKVVSFDLMPSAASIDLYVGQQYDLTASGFTPVNATYQGVTWNITSGKDKTDIIARSMTGCTVQGLAVGQATLAVGSLDEYVSKAVTINVKVCTSAPAAPTGITFSKTSGIKLNDVITATATPAVPYGGVIPTQYNWNSGNYFTIEGSATGPTVYLKAIASLTGQGGIQVNAQNDCGTSDNYSNATSLTVLNCSEAPVIPGTITVIPATVTAGSTFTASILTVTGATSYEWSVPSGLSISGQGSTSVTYTTSKATTISGSEITVKAVNACGQSGAKPSGTTVTVTAPAGHTVINGVFTRSAGSSVLQEYATFDQLISTYGFSATGANLLLDLNDLSGVYTWQSAKDACAAKGSGWRLPNLAELGNLYTQKAMYGLSNDRYWSSTERSNPDGAWIWSYYYGDTIWDYKTNPAFVRCVWNF